MERLIIFLTLILWTETPRAAVIKQDEPFMKREINTAVNLRHQNEEKRHDSTKVVPKEGASLNETDFFNAKFVDTKSGNYKADEDPTLTAGLFEGDIDGIDISDIESVDKNAVLDLDRQWPNATIPYDIANNFSNRSRALIVRSMEEYHRKTCIRFVPKTSAHKDFVHIMDAGGCFSKIGREGGAQNLSLAPNCFHFGVIVHELMHVVGFLHEQSRADRDDYITIVTSNIIKGMESNFWKYTWKRIQSLGAAYDLGSIMHYGPFAFARNKSQPTITSNVKGKSFGQRKGFSEIDLKKINKLYQCQMNKTGGNCTDIDGQCADFAKQGQCEKNPVYMSFYCIKACGLCSS